MFYISWIKDVCAFMSVHLRSGRRFHLPPSFFCFFSPPSSTLFTFLQSHLLMSRFVSLYRFSPSLLSSSVGALHHRPSVHSLGSTGSETVTQSSLVIGHGHANQTGRNLQLIRILPPAIIVPPPHHLPPFTPRPHKINYIRGSIPTIGFPVLKLHYRKGKKKIPGQHSRATFSITQRQAKS